ncbi:hypothetical protein [Eisenbergiella massiliensis]|uniref:hypothetical protein n=3 Tax=Lachnospiraceae TaxID=186803 RepID=UPI003996C3EB
MSIVSGYKKFKKYILTSSGFQLVSHWTNANTLQFDDGKTAQAKLGAIDGISSSKDSSSDKIAASTKLVSELNSNFSGQFGGMTFWVNGTGDPCVTYKVGADTVSKKLGSDAILLASSKTGTTAINIASLYPNNYAAFTSKNFLVVMKNINYSLNIWGHGSSNHENQGSSTKTITPSISYTSETGALSVTCTAGSFSLGASYGHGNGGTVTCTPYYDVYLVM